MGNTAENKLQLVENKGGLQQLFETDRMMEAIKSILPKHITPERVLKMALVAASRSPKLYQCTIESWTQALMRSSELGLDCSGTLGQAYIIPFYNNTNNVNAYEATFMPGYRGLIELARRSGQVSNIDVHNVYAKDKFRLVFGTDQVLEHEPYLGDEDPGNHVVTYMVVTLKDGSKQIEVMTNKEIDKVRNFSKAKNSGPWITWPGEMQRKTVVKRGLKYVPMSSELEKALLYDNEVSGVLGDDIMQVEAMPGRDRIEALKDAIKSNMKEVEGEDVESEPPEKQPEELKEKDGSTGPKKYVEPDKPKPDPDGKISEDQKVELQEIIHEDSISKSAVSLILESHGAKLISELRGKDFVSVKQALREVRK